ncbi:N-alpha-acetyltransferase 80 [Anabrus simplex]|uniref:N-alpha-acetyltransferase 80 n=1 Tax=Anabrus simplex TaxID=316456 RepID=UPI0035A39F95
MSVLMIHQYPHLLEECCTLINSEWPRSKTARMRSLLASCDNLPTCLVLVINDQVVGHSKISAIPSIPTGCFVESVVIHSSLRGKGFGKQLMIKTEEFARSLGMQTVFLSTHDQQGFYKKLGYAECAPVTIYGYYTTSSGHLSTKTCTKPNIPKTSSISAHNIPIPPPPPPPPPPPSQISITLPSKNTKTFMRKDLI